MANISDVYDISFEASSEALAIALLAYVKKLEESPVEYNLTSEAERDGLTVNGNWAAGRWVYSSNLEGYFANREEWCGNDAEAEWQPVLKLLKAGETIQVSWSEDEPGCEVYVDGAGNIEYHKGNVQVSIDYEEHDRPDCQMMTNPDGTWYCEDHDQEQAEEARYCEAVEA